MSETVIEICGRPARIVPAGRKHKRLPDLGKSRYVVDGIKHPKGEPIRFKSRERAERHIRNMKLERP